MRLSCTLGLACVAVLSACSPRVPVDQESWDPRTAAQYLDSRMNWWIGWPHAARDHGTFCVSCHTVLPYALARPALQRALGEAAPAPAEVKLLENVSSRVQAWNQASPFYDDQHSGSDKTRQSRGTESVLNALILSSTGARAGRVSPATQAALDIMWAQQRTDGPDRGAWDWLNFGLRPWEAADSRYYGATLAALAVGYAPAVYRSDPAVRDHLQRLREYLDRESASQSLEHRLLLLWASMKLPGLLDQTQQQSIATEVLDAQRSDGGWSLAPLARRHWRVFGLFPAQSDGYATGLATFVLEQISTPRARAAAAIGRAWLRQNQQIPRGQWVARSLNKRRDLSTPVGLFMSDAATAYAVLALTTTPQSSASQTQAAVSNALVR